jgi:hypothetical protein
MSDEEEGTFFEYGKVILKASDFKTRMVECHVCMPCCLMQTVIPHLLAGGSLHNLRIREPLAVWIPKIPAECFIEEVSQIANIEDKVQVSMREEIVRVSKLFTHLQPYLKNPADIVPMLPLGTYVEFEYRCVVDEIIKVIVGIEGILVHGVPEFQWALAKVLRLVISDFERFDALIPVKST